MKVRNGFVSNSRFRGQPDGQWGKRSAYDYMMLGIILVSLEDGEVCELPNPDDEKVKEILKEKLGIDVDPSTIHTYVQYISNDNY